MTQSFPKLKIIAVGKVKKRWIEDGVQTYLKRLPEVEVVEVKDSDKDQEAQKIQTLLKGGDHLVALTEEGTLYSSTQFARFVGQHASNALVLVLGGPEGIAPSLKQRANILLSLSPMTFPHELARLMLVEQLYRAKTILQNSSYHK